MSHEIPVISARMNVFQRHLNVFSRLHITLKSSHLYKDFFYLLQCYSVTFSRYLAISNYTLKSNIDISRQESNIPDDGLVERLQ